MHSSLGETGFGQSLAIHRALRVLPHDKRSNRAICWWVWPPALWYADFGSIDSNGYKPFTPLLLPGGTAECVGKLYVAYLPAGSPVFGDFADYLVI